MSLASALLKGGSHADSMRPYVLWRRTGGSTKPVEARWRREGVIQLPLPYWDLVERATAGRTQEDRVDFERYGRFDEGAWTEYGQSYLQMMVAAGAPDSWLQSARYGNWPEVQHALFNFFGDLSQVEYLRHYFGRVTSFQFITQEARRKRRFEWCVVPPMNKVFDLRSLPNAGAEHGAGPDPLDASSRPYVLGLPGMMHDIGCVVQGWPWQVDWDIPMSEVPIPEVQVAVDQAIERGLA